MALFDRLAWWWLGRRLPVMGRIARRCRQPVSDAILQILDDADEDRIGEIRNDDGSPRYPDD
jgi:hypothetical protein